MNPLIYPVLFFGSVMAACGQLLFKTGASGAVAWFDFINIKVIAGLFAYGLSTVVWIWALSKAPLLVVYPFTVLTFVLVYAGALVLYGERLTVTGSVGVFLVLSGLFVVMWNTAA